MNPSIGDHSRILERDSPVPFDICGDDATNANQRKSTVNNKSRGTPPPSISRGPLPAVRWPTPVGQNRQPGQQSRSGSPINWLAVLRPRRQQPRSVRSNTTAGNFSVVGVRTRCFAG